MPPRRPERSIAPHSPRARPEVEPLEGRWLLSRAATLPARQAAVTQVPASVRTPRQTLGISVPSPLIGPDTGEVVVTVTRSAPAGSAALRRPLAVDFVETVTTIPADRSSNKSLIARTGLTKTVKFRPGQTSLTIPLTPPAVPAGSESVDVVAGVSLPGMSFYNWPATADFVIFPSADKVPPTIVATSITPQGLALTFSKPMDPNTVQDVRNYEVTGSDPPTVTPGAKGLVVQMPTPEHVALRAADYDPATRTVTLIPADPQGYANYYASPPAGTLPLTSISIPLWGVTDLQGNQLRAMPASVNRLP